MNYKLYVLYYDDQSKKIANSEFKNSTCTQLYYIRSTKILENIMYQNELLKNRHEWINVRFVGCISYRITKKCPQCTLNNMINAFQNVPSNVKVIGIKTMKDDKLVSSATQYHPLFKQIWIKLLIALGYQNCIKKDYPNPIIWNAWVATPEIMLQYINFIKKVIHIMNTNQEIKKLLNMDSKYEGQMPLARKKQIFGHPYYTYHPFILERLPTFFFAQHGIYIHKLFYTF